MEIQKDSVEIFKQLFSGLQRGYGLYDPTLPKDYDFKHNLPTIELYQQHLEGKISLGIVPITDKGNCRFGVIDDDSHKKGGVKKDFDYNTLLKKIKFFNFPLSVVTSKTGGAHAWLFLDQFYPAHAVIHILKKFTITN